MTVRTGVVERFDAAEGLGVVRLDDGRRIGFHATQLRDGTRRIDVGAPVEATILPGHRGELEALDVKRIPR